MKIFLTGARGMVGRNVAKLLPKEHSLIAPSKEELNLKNFDQLKTYLSLNKPDLIIHSAGLVGGIKTNFERQREFLLENMEMGKNLITAAHATNIKKIINLGSSCMYPKFGKNPRTEDQILTGAFEETNEGYAIAKIFNLKLCSYIMQEDSNFEYKTLIPSNLFGVFDKFDIETAHMLPAAIKKVHDAKISNSPEVEIWGSGKSKREYLFGQDCADFIWFAVNNFSKIPKIMNVGTGIDHEINYFYKITAKVIGYNGAFKNNLSYPDGMKNKLVDISLQKKLGWQPSFSLEEGIAETYKYFINHIN